LVKVELNLPIRGFVYEMLMHGLAKIMDINLLEYEGMRDDFIVFDLLDDNQVWGEVLHKINENFGKAKDVEKTGGSKLTRNDRDSYAKTYSQWFGIQLDENVDYISFLSSILNGVAVLLKKNRINVLESFSTINVKKGKMYLGVKDYGYAIIPSIIKQMEYYERSTEYMRPTTSVKSMIYLDPLWFSILSIGILYCYAGYYGGSYYFVTKPDIDMFFGSPYLNLALNCIHTVSSSNIRLKKSLEYEEIYEFLLSLDLAEREKATKEHQEYLWPLRIYKENLERNVFVAKKVYDIDLSMLLDFCKKYYNNIDTLRIMGEREYRIKLYQESMDPLKALFVLAEREARTNISDDNEMIAFIAAKDIYRAVNSRNYKLLENTLFRLLRKSSVVRSGDRYSYEVSVVFRAFSKVSVVNAILNAMS